MAIDVKSAVRGVFESAVKMFLFHVSLTLVVLSLFKVTRLVYVAMLCSGALSIVPFPPNAVCVVPAFLELLAKQHVWSGLALVAMYYVVSAAAFTKIYEEIPNSMHPYITGLSIFGGMSAYQNALHGAFMGPTLLVIFSLAFNLYRTCMEECGEWMESVGLPTGLTPRPMPPNTHGTHSPHPRGGTPGGSLVIK